MESEVERVDLMHKDVEQAKIDSRPNPFTGEHVEGTLQLKTVVVADKKEFLNYFKDKLPTHMRPQKDKFSSVKIGHRFKKI